MTKPTTPEVLTVLYDGACPLCRREIAHLQGLARFARLPGALAALEWAYRGFLRVRPRLQAMVRQIDRSKERSA